MLDFIDLDLFQLWAGAGICLELNHLGQKLNEIFSFFLFVFKLGEFDVKLVGADYAFRDLSTVSL